MKLVSFGTPGRERPGVMLGESILDIDLASDGRFPTVRRLLEAGAEGMALLSERVAAGPRDEWLVPAKGMRLGPPITDPSKIVCVGLNYLSHAEEQNRKAPERPLLFGKASSSLGGQGDPIPYPLDEQNLDYEAELAFVIGRRAFRVDAADWESYVAGYTIVNDVSARDTQFADKKWFRGKSFDGCCPMGPWLVTRDELTNPHALAISARLNGELRQDGCTDDLICAIPELLAFVTRNITFQPGDVISTGTPMGVGIFRDPVGCMRPGDEISITIDRIGTLTNRVEAIRDQAPSPYPYP